MSILNTKITLFLKQIFLLSPILFILSCEQQEKEEAEEIIYYNCVAYTNGSELTRECVSLSSISPIDWLYESEEECLSGCGNYNCINDNCISEQNGQYSEENDCLIACNPNNDLNYGYNCIDGDCVFEENGQYESLEECVNNCQNPEGQALFYLYDGVPNTIFNEFGENTVYFDVGDENNLNFSEIGNLSTITQSGFINSPLCINNSNTIILNLSTPEFGYAIYSWRARNFSNTTIYDFGTFLIENNECVSIEVDLN